MKKNAKVFFGSIILMTCVVVLTGYLVRLPSSGLEPEVDELHMPQHIANINAIHFFCDGLKPNFEYIIQDLKASGSSFKDFMSPEGKHTEETQRYTDKLMEEIDSGEKDKGFMCVMGIASYGKEEKLKRNYLLGEENFAGQ